MTEYILSAADTEERSRNENRINSLKSTAGTSTEWALLPYCCCTGGPYGRQSIIFTDLVLTPVETVKESSKETIMAGEIAEGAFRKTTMKTGDSLKTTKLIRSQKTGVLLPREGTFVRNVENLGRKLILVDFGPAGEEYLFPDEILAEPRND